MSQATDALRRLQEGNQRFVEGAPLDHPIADARVQTVDGQQPFCIVLGCSDSRVPAELVFDQGLGDLFVIRVAGNIATPAQIGSVEFAATQFGTPLVVVLGHSRCGAIRATIDQLRAPQTDLSPGLTAIVDNIAPSVEALVAEADNGNERDKTNLVDRATRANISATVEHLRGGSQIIGTLMDRGELQIVGAQYQLETGAVEFFDSLP